MGFYQTRIPEFKRKSITIAKKQESPFKAKLTSSINQLLIINSNQKMADEITAEFRSTLPHCKIIFAPSLFLAEKILAKNNFDLIVASPILPDGCIIKLKTTLNKLLVRPDLVVIGSLSKKLKQEIAECFTTTSCEYKSTNSPKVINYTKSKDTAKQDRIKKLGADLRNDLNNPLQEIVTLLFVAQNMPNEEASTGIKSALSAIEKAANNMAVVVRGLEGKIKVFVE